MLHSQAQQAFVSKVVTGCCFEGLLCAKMVVGVTESVSECCICCLRELCGSVRGDCAGGSDSGTCTVCGVHHVGWEG
jgi:hypothetical protein